METCSRDIYFNLRKSPFETVVKKFSNKFTLMNDFTINSYFLETERTPVSLSLAGADINYQVIGETNNPENNQIYKEVVSFENSTINFDAPDTIYFNTWSDPVENG